MDEPQSNPGGDFNKRHVSGMLKFLEDEEQQAEALDTAATYRKMFASRDWEPVMSNIRHIANEDPMKIENKRRPARIVTGRPKLKTSQSAPLANMVNEGEETAPAAPPKLTTSLSLISFDRAPKATPRERWDTLSHSPATPLSPTPMGNAFTSGGFWEQLTPQTPKTPAAAQTPDTSILYSDFSPLVLRDPEAKTAYNIVKADIDAMARTICANRLSSLSKIDNSDDVPMSLVKTKDQLKAAAITLYCRQLDLQVAIDAELPQKMKALADEEVKIVKAHVLDDLCELDDAQPWPEECGELLEKRRELIRMHVDRRKSQALSISDQAVQLAWATRIQEDVEQAYEVDADSESCCSDDTMGYDYSNFLRSIKGEVGSSSELVSTAGGMSFTDLASLRSSGTNDGSGMFIMSRETTFASQSSVSPAKSPSGSPKKRVSEKASIKDPPRITTGINEGGEDDTSPPLSPSEKAFRRKAASPVELDSWAQQLKTMETQQKAIRRESFISRRAQNLGLQIITPQPREFLSDDSDKSWTCVTASQLEHGAISPSQSVQAGGQGGKKSMSPLRQAMSPPPMFTLPAMPKELILGGKVYVEKEVDEVMEMEKEGDENKEVRQSKGEEWWAKELERMEEVELERQMREIERKGGTRSVGSSRVDSERTHCKCEKHGSGKPGSERGRSLSPTKRRRELRGTFGVW